jgi:sugar transferase (PEP-CTERM/EpsH1 system associated)
VQLTNHLPPHRYRHTVVAMTTVSSFQDRVTAPDVEFVALHKPEGHAIPLYPKILRLLRQRRPDVVHTCNLAGLEVVPLAWLARVPRRIHAEHGWDVHDLRGDNPRYARVRRLYRPFVSHYVSVSAELDSYLGSKVGVHQQQRSLVANGVDTQLFRPRSGAANPVPEDCPFRPGQHWVVGTVGRMQAVKNQPLLARAFVQLVQRHPEARARVRLAMVGEGPLLTEVASILAAAGMSDLAWLPGARSDVHALLPAFDCFALPSLSEGTSCTLQEAMACGLPVVATAVGGNPGLVEPRRTGWLVPSGDETALAQALWEAHSQPESSAAYGAAARGEAERRFSLAGMLTAYDQLFAGAALKPARPAPTPDPGAVA